jgi:hypothetical protein
VNILVKHNPADSWPWYAIMLDDYGARMYDTGATAVTREQAIDKCVERYRAQREAVPDELIPYPPVPQSLKAV